MSLINKYWIENVKPFEFGKNITVKVYKNVCKIYFRKNKPIAIAFSSSSSGQFGEFNFPFYEWSSFLWHYAIEFPDKDFPDGSSSRPLKEYHQLLLDLGNYSYGIKTVPITTQEASVKKVVLANNGTFSSENIANHIYQELVLRGIAFTPLFSKGIITDFDIKMFTSENILTLNRLQKTLKRVEKEMNTINSYEESRLSENLIDSDLLMGSIFSDKVGMFVTTIVGNPISSSLIMDLDEFISLMTDAFWTIEQTILNKIYITDMNINNILYHDQRELADNAGWFNGDEDEEDRMCGFKETVREYNWKIPETGKQVSYRVKNYYSRLVFIDLGTSRIENPTFGDSRVLDLATPISKKARLELVKEVRDNIINALRFIAVSNGFEETITPLIDVLNTNENIFFQWIEELDECSIFVKEQDQLLEYPVSEKYISKVFR